MLKQLANYFIRSEEVCEKVARDLSVEDKLLLLRDRMKSIGENINNHLKNVGPVSRDYIYKNFVCQPDTPTDRANFHTLV